MHSLAYQAFPSPCGVNGAVNIIESLVVSTVLLMFVSVPLRGKWCSEQLLLELSNNYLTAFPSPCGVNGAVNALQLVVIVRLEYVCFRPLAG